MDSNLSSLSGPSQLADGATDISTPPSSDSCTVSSKAAVSHVPEAAGAVSGQGAMGSGRIKGAAKTAKKPFPKIIKIGHTTVKIYHSMNRGCDSYTVVHYLGKKRLRQNFARLDLATTAATTLATKLSQGELKVLELKNEDRLSYVRAIEALAPTGVPLEMAALEYAEAYKILQGASLLDAVRFFAKLHPSGMAKKNVPEIVTELIAAKEGDGVSDVYVKDLKSRLGRFEKKFTGKIALVTSGEIEDFLRGLKDKNQKTLSGRSRNNFRRAIGTLFYYAETRGYLPKGAVDVESVPIAKEEEGAIEIFRPAEMERLLAKATETTPELVPFLTIGAFAGLRHAEIERLDWSEVRIEEGFIEVKASKAKTASRRLVPIAPNLKLWLEDYKKAAGEVTPYASMSKQLLWLAEAVDAAWKAENPPGVFAWKRNALRHSFISYRVAEIQNVAQVALEAGNSPRVVFANYRELVRPKEAAAWFGITPAGVEAGVKARSGETKPENVVQLRSAIA